MLIGWLSYFVGTWGYICTIGYIYIYIYITVLDVNNLIEKFVCGLRIQDELYSSE